MGTTTEKLQAALDSKQAVQTALEEKGLEVTDDFSTYGNLIGELENTSDSTATSGDIIEGAVAYTASGRTVGTFSPTGGNISYDNTTSKMSATTVQDAIDEHVTNKSNPHGVTKSQVGLSNVPNVKTNDQTPTYTAASTLSKLVSGEKLSVSFGKIAKAISDLISHLSNKSNPHGVTAAQIGAIPTSQKGTASGVAELDSSGKVPSSQLPAYVDDVLEYTSKSSFPSTGETGKIYVDTTTNKTYRWSGSAYVEISASLALGETSSTAYRGDRGKTAYEHSQKTSGNPHNVTKSDVGLGNVENKSSETIRGELTKANVTDALGYTPPTTNTTYSAATQSAAGLLSAEDKKQLDYGGAPIVTTAGTGAAYTATVDGMTALTVGMRLTLVPHTNSTTATATLNVNNLGAKMIRQRLSTNTSITAVGPSDNWIISGKPITVVYDGTYWVAELTRPDANTFYGTLPVAKGGTGATTAADALTNLGAVGVADIVDNLESTSANLPLSANQGKVLKDNMTDPVVIVQGQTSSESISGSAMVERSITINIPTGYTYKGVINAWSSSGHVAVTNMWQGDITDTTAKVGFYARNIDTSSKSAYFIASVLCVKTALISS